MNGLSWLMYAADVSEGLKQLAIGAAVVSGIGAAGSALFGAIFRFGSYMDDDERAMGGTVLGYAKRALIITALSSVVAVLVPGRQTVVLIAASEVGETVLASKEAQAIGGEAGALATDSLKLLRKYVTEQLGEEAK